MLFAPYERYQYARAPLVEVICQLRFPTILSIGAKEPAEFQEAIRKDFPQYAARQEQLPPKVVKKGNATALEPQKPITNYNFISEDGRWKLNLTQGFIALSTLGYHCWEDFAQRLDKPLASFIQLYQPAFFERIGLRYVNAVSRKALGLEDVPWVSLIQPAFLGVLAELDVDEQAASRSSVDAHLALPEGQRLKLAKELMEQAQNNVLYLMDEPTVGLHPLDVEHFLALLNGMVEGGATVIAVEHNQQVIAASDWVVELGPGGGVDGGRAVFSGTPQELAACTESATGRFLEGW